MSRRQGEKKGKKRLSVGFLDIFQKLQIQMGTPKWSSTRQRVLPIAKEYRAAIVPFRRDCNYQRGRNEDQIISVSKFQFARL